MRLLTLMTGDPHERRRLARGACGYFMSVLLFYDDLFEERWARDFVRGRERLAQVGHELTVAEACLTSMRSFSLRSAWIYTKGILSLRGYCRPCKQQLLETLRLFMRRADLRCQVLWRFWTQSTQDVIRAALGQILPVGDDEWDGG